LDVGQKGLSRLNGKKCVGEIQRRGSVIESDGFYPGGRLRKSKGPKGAKLDSVWCGNGVATNRSDEGKRGVTLTLNM